MKKLFTYHLPIARHTNRAGFTLTEVAIVLGIAGLVVGGVWAVASSAYEKWRINQAVQELNTAVQNMLTLYQNRVPPNTTWCDMNQGDMNDSVIKVGVISAQWVIPSTTPSCKTAISPWGPKFVIWTTADTTGATTKAFGVSFFGPIPTDACIALLLQGTSCDTNQPGCPYQVGGLSASDTLPSPPPAGGWQAIMTPAEAANLCGTNQFAWFAYKL
jgi:prepilin-type N-terminal cleavage/methylation domain-containing protein